MSEKPNQKTRSALVLRTLTREGERIVCRRYVVRGPIVWSVFTPAVPLRWRKRAILLPRTRED